MARFQLVEPPGAGTADRVAAAWWAEWHEQASPEIKADFAKRGIDIPPVETIDPTGWKSPLQYTPQDNRYAVGQPIPVVTPPDPAQIEREMVKRAKAQKERDRIHPCGYKPDGESNCGLSICWISVEPAVSYIRNGRAI